MTIYLKPVSRDIVFPSKTIRAMNKSIYRISGLKLQLDIEHSLLLLNICTVMQCQRIVSKEG